ncbi:histidine kinase [Streptomyces sp. DSM 44915]|uniref:Histidine kinase n=1 Tax=Streptomyces chisholmiae TaxID=3075540 RepID=A0ABU2JZY4_9ACTN|nr:histidine kinase [Streptomyces sp. DSM 44915]MDT0270094.1 histidine kinase [Streptomyces sp. DSM 44915]
MWFSGWWAEWRRASHRRRVHVYTRYSLYFIGLMELLTVGAALANDRADSAWRALVVVGVLTGGHTVLMLLTLRDALTHYLGTGPEPRRLLVGGVALTCAISLSVAAGMALDLLAPSTMPVAVFVTAYLAVPLSLLRPRRAAVLVAAPVGCSLVAQASYQLSATSVMIQLSVLVAMVVFLAGTTRATGWTLRVLDRVDAAREVEARLAVAEERLRFGRDLHDVLGRNLSVIALKSELAAQLVRRGSTEAIGQLAEVQDIARQSQREIREVVRGYREADLRAEVAGARGVLEAADIRCSVTGVTALEGALPPRVAATLGWVVREGATNVLRHASASRCEIWLTRSDDRRLAELTLENDGVPAGGSRAGGAGAGLVGLRERLAALDGSLTTQLTPDGIFRLTARVPLRTPAAGRAADVAGGAGGASGVGSGDDADGVGGGAVAGGVAAGEARPGARGPEPENGPGAARRPGSEAREARH